MRFLSKFVDSNDREVRRIQPWVDEANALEAEFEALSDDDIRAQYAEIREEIRALAASGEPSEDELHHPDLERRRELRKERRKRENEAIQKALDEVAPEVFAMAREAMKRTRTAQPSMISVEFVHSHGRRMSRVISGIEPCSS